MEDDPMFNGTEYSGLLGPVSATPSGREDAHLAPPQSAAPSPQDKDVIIVKTAKGKGVAGKVSGRARTAAGVEDDSQWDVRKGNWTGWGLTKKAGAESIGVDTLKIDAKNIMTGKRTRGGGK